jgi:hypothetical protein
VNLDNTTVNFTQQFYTSQGQPMLVTFRNYPQGEVEHDTAIIGTLPPLWSFNFALFDAGRPLQVRWSGLATSWRKNESLSRLI